MAESQPFIHPQPPISFPSWLQSYKVLWVIALLDLLVLGIIFFVLMENRQRDLDSAASTLESVSRSMDDILSWRFEKIHLALLNTVDEVEKQSRAGTVSWEGLERFGQTLDERLPETLGFLLTDSLGQVIYASPRALTGDISVANNEHFIQLRDNPFQRIAISKPFYGHSWPHPIIVLAMRYAQPNGEFGGIVACEVSINMFSAVLGAVDIVGPSAVATLWDKRIGLITQYPEGQFYLSSKPSPQLRKLMMQDAPPSIYHNNRPDFNNKNRIAFYRKLRQWPLYLSIGVFEQEVLENWRHEVIVLGFLVMVCVFISFWSGIAYTRNVRALAVGERRYKGLFNNMQAGLALFEPVFLHSGAICDFRYVEINKAYCTIFRANQEDIVGKTLLHRISGKTNNALQWINPLITTAETGEPARFDFFLEGNNLWIDVVAYRPEAGKIAILCIDVSESKFAQARASRVSQMYAALSRCNQAIVRCTTRDELFAEICKAAVEAGGMKGAWIGLVEAQTGKVNPVSSFGLDQNDLNHLNVSAKESDPYGSGPTGCAIRYNEAIWSNNSTADPRLVPWWQLVQKTGFLSVGALPLRQRGEVVGNLTLYSMEVGAFDTEVRELLGEMATNLSFALDNFAWEDERRRNEARINELAFYDQLTGLANRPLLTERIRLAVAAGMHNNQFNALMFIDLDNFKAINDTLGHDQGDTLLQQVGKRLQALVNAEDTVARFGGDEFVLLLQDVSDNSDEAVKKVALISRQVLTTIRAPIVINGVTCNCTASVGVALFGRQGITPEELLKQADLAMYQAKDAGRNTVRFFDPQMQLAVIERIALERELEEAIGREQFVLHYQPLIDIDDKIIGAEALIRWQHPRRGLLAPAEFIPVAEENGMIIRIGMWVLREACSQIARWAEIPALSRLIVSINVSARQFRESGFVRDVTAIVQKSGIDPSRLKLELTESQLAVSMQEIIASMVELSNLGLRFSLDDFGTGYSSMAYLKLLPLDQLKIDRSFIRDLLSDPNDAAIASIIIALSQSLGLSAVAEGVETSEQKRALINMGCTLFQGYLFSVPLGVSDFEKYIANGAAADSDEQQA